MITIRPTPFRALLATALVALTPLALHAAPPPLIPLDVLFADSQMRSVQLSPDGQHLAFLTTLGTGKIGIALMDLSTGKIEPLVAAKDENIKFYLWKGNDRIVFGGDIGGNESSALRAISLSKRNVVELANSHQANLDDNADTASIVDNLKFDPQRVLIIGMKGVGSWEGGVYLLDVQYGDRNKAPGAEVEGASGLLSDNAGVIRCLDRLDGKNIVHYIRAGLKSDFVKIGQSPSDTAIEAPTWEPIVFGADNQTLYVITREPGHSDRLRAYNTTSRSFLPGLDYTLEGSVSAIGSAWDRSSALAMSWDRSKLQGVYYTTDREHVHWFDAGRAALQAKIDGALPNTFNRITSSSADDQVHIIVSTSDRQTPVYYILNLQNPAKGRPAIMMLGSANPNLHAESLRPQLPVSYQARDGLTIHGYLTLPAGAEGKRVPLIVHPHGGPYGIRDEWGFDPEVQLYANRGYAVLQPNYRGSGGYGTEFLLAGRKEWGGKMQDDLTDGVKWAIAQGYADPARVAIVGASYGGYAALAGVTFTPELYCCGVNYVGVSDLTIITSHARIGGGERLFQKNWIGDDAQYLHDRSPVNFVQNIRVPTLHAYGENDPRVDIDHWKRLKAELDRYHKPYEFVREGNEGHGFGNENARTSFFRHVEDFLARNLAHAGTVKVGPTETIDLPAKGTD